MFGVNMEDYETLSFGLFDHGSHMQMKTDDWF